MTLGTPTQKAGERPADGVAATGTARSEQERRPAPAALSQRDLVRASLLRCPDR